MDASSTKDVREMYAAAVYAKVAYIKSRDIACAALQEFGANVGEVDACCDLETMLVQGCHFEQSATEALEAFDEMVAEPWA